MGGGMCERYFRNGCCDKATLFYAGLDRNRRLHRTRTDFEQLNLALFDDQHILHPHKRLAWFCHARCIEPIEEQAAWQPIRVKFDLLESWILSPIDECRNFLSDEIVNLEFHDTGNRQLKPDNS